MEFPNFMRKLLDSQESGQLDVPSTAHLAFIPQRQRSNILFMNSEPPTMDTMKVVPTVFIGTIRPNYTEDMWEKDLTKWKTHIQNQNFKEIQLIPLREDSTKMDSADAIPKIEEALELINDLPLGDGIRVICLGTGYSNFLYEAISYLLKEWKEPDGKTNRMSKNLQFITSGDTENRDLSDFCQWLCISGTCKSVAFYNTMMYHPFGYCSSQYIARK